MGVWIEIASPATSMTAFLSLPLVGVWIEITTLLKIAVTTLVTPLGGSVD